MRWLVNLWRRLRAKRTQMTGQAPDLVYFNEQGQAIGIEFKTYPACPKKFDNQLAIYQAAQRRMAE